jgi:hypothetical protein
MERLTNSWANKESLPSAAKIMADHANIPGTTADSIEKRLQEGYFKRLY